MAQQAAHDQTLLLVRLATAMLVIAALYWGQGVLIPIVLAALLSFVLAPVADWLERWHVPRAASVILVAVLAFAALGGVVSIITNQLVSLAESLPKYQQNIEQRFRLFQNNEPGAFEKTANMFGDIKEDVDREAEERTNQAAEADSQPFETPARSSVRSNPGGDSSEERPALVEIVEPELSAFELLKQYAGPLLGPVGTAGLVAVFVIFILLQREDLRDRMIRLMGTRLDVTTRALDDAGNRISRYLLMQLIINVTYGLPVAIGLWLIGVPSAILWGLLAILLRFIPYIGPWLAASMPILLSLAVFDGWLWPLAVVGLLVSLELFSNNVMEPWLYGSSTGLSPVAVILAVVFWSALWGGVGLLLAIPLTVCLVVASKHIPPLEFITVLLSRESALPPAERFYQRLLAGDDDEAEELALKHAEQHGLMNLYDQVMLPAIHLAESDRHAGRLEPDRVHALEEYVSEIIEEMGEWQQRWEDGQGEERAETPRSNDQVLFCLPARDKADELAARMFAQVLNTQGVTADAVSVKALAGEIMTRIEGSDMPLVCISALPPGAVSHARYLCKRLDRQFPDLRIIVGLWNVTDNLERITARLTEAGADHVITTLEEGTEQVRRGLSALNLITTVSSKNEGENIAASGLQPSEG